MCRRITHYSKEVYESLCPFLYQTPTLNRCVLLQWRKPMSTNSRDSRKSLSRTANEDTHHSDAVGSSSPEQAKNGSTAMYYDFPGSTITSAERAAFRKLISKFGSSSSVKYHGRQHQREGAYASEQTINESTHQNTIQALLDKNVDVSPTRILSLFAPETPEMISEREEASTTENSNPRSDGERHPYPAWQVRNAALNALKTISETLNTALASSTNPTREYRLNPRPVELAMWQTIESQIFAQMTIMQSLNNPATAAGKSPSFSEYQRAILEDYQMLENAPPCLRSLDPRTPLLPLLTILYPASTLLAIRIFLRHLPISPCALALMPQVKSMGPVSYLLTSNVHFFNALIHLYWTIYSDFTKVKSMMEEMRQNHINPDSGTVAVIESIRRDRNNDLNIEKELEIQEGGLERQPKKEGRSRHWWQMQEQSKTMDELVEYINSGRSYALS